MKYSDLIELIRHAIVEKKLTTAEKHKKEQIVKGMKKTFKGDEQSMYAIATAKAKKLAEIKQIATTYQFTPDQFNILKKFGAQSSIDGRILYISDRIYNDLESNKNNSQFKQEFYATAPMGDEYLVSQILSAIKKSLNLGNTATIKDKKYFVLKGTLTKNNNFNFPNPFRKDINENSSKDTTIEKLIRTAYRDGYLTGHEGMAGYILNAAKKIQDKWDTLNDNEKPVFRDHYYDLFLKMIHKK